MAPKPWTVMVYMVADAPDLGLFHAAINNINEMTLAVPNDSINVVVQLEAPTQFPATRWLIQDGKAKELTSTPDIESFQPKCLLDFVEMCTSKYPGQNYLLVLWGHGEGIDWIDPLLKPVGALPGAEGSMTVARLGKALRGFKINEDHLVVGFDACLMGMVEVYYEIHHFAEWVVGAADEIPTTGWPYKQILSRLVGDSKVLPVDLVKAIVGDFVGWYNRTSHASRVSFSACDLAQNKCDELVNAVRSLISELTTHLDSESVLTSISAARRYAEDYTEKACVDLHAFCWKLQRALPSQLRDARAAAGAVVKNLEQGQFVIRSKHSRAYPERHLKNSSAVSICFPQSRALASSVPGWKINWKSYERLPFNRATGWSTFVTNFLDSTTNQGQSPITGRENHMPAASDQSKSLKTTGKDLKTTGKDLKTTGKDLKTTGKDLKTTGKDLKTTGKDLKTTLKDLKTTVKN